MLYNHNNNDITYTYFIGVTNRNTYNLGGTTLWPNNNEIRPMLMAEAFESLGLRGLCGLCRWFIDHRLKNPGGRSRPRLEVLKKLDIIHCRRCLAALEEDSCIDGHVMSIKMSIKFCLKKCPFKSVRFKGSPKSHDWHDMFNPLKLPMGYPIPGEPPGFRKTWSTLQWSHTGVLALFSD